MLLETRPMGATTDLDLSLTALRTTLDTRPDHHQHTVLNAGQQLLSKAPAGARHSAAKRHRPPPHDMGDGVGWCVNSLASSCR